MTKLTLNKAAIEQLGGNAKVRVRVAFGALQLRPTARVSGKRLPAGEVLLDIKRMGIFSQVDLSVLGDVATAFAPNAGRLVPTKHGWMTLVVADGEAKPTVKAG